MKAKLLRKTVSEAIANNFIMDNKCLLKIRTYSRYLEVFWIPVTAMIAKGLVMRREPLTTNNVCGMYERTALNIACLHKIRSHADLQRHLGYKAVGAPSSGIVRPFPPGLQGVTFTVSADVRDWTLASRSAGHCASVNQSGWAHELTQTNRYRPEARNSVMRVQEMCAFPTDV